MGGAYLNFEVRLRGDIIILKILKKYHENQREKLILMVFFSNESLIHAPTLLSILIYNDKVIIIQNTRIVPCVIGNGKTRLHYPLYCGG
jgi:hypothetical protein